jgi:uncharacterized RDD family membrane protein YckC
VQADRLRVVTPEAVVLTIDTAGLGSRALARALDYLIQGAAISVLVIASAIASSGGSGFGIALLIIDLFAVLVILLGYPVAWETFWRGRTPGKAALGLRVVTVEGAPIRFRHALVRGVVGLVDFYFVGPEVGVLAVLLSRRDQRLGDMAAGTMVVRERSGARPSAPVSFFAPRGWEGYVHQLDVSRMSPGDYEAVRAFLLRAAELAPEARVSLAARMAGPVSSRLAPPPPPGMPAELWLWCAAAAYQLRHGGPPPPGQWGAPAPRPQWGPPQGPPAPPAAPTPPPAPTPSSAEGQDGFSPPG